MSIQMIAIVSGIVFGAGLVVAKLLIGRALARRAQPSAEGKIDG